MFMVEVRVISSAMVLAICRKIYGRNGALEEKERRDREMQRVAEDEATEVT